MYTGKYYNSLTNTTVNADITLAAKYLLIVIQDETGTSRNVTWFWDEVVPERTNDGFRLKHTGYPEQVITVTDIHFEKAANEFLSRKRQRPAFAGPLAMAMATGGVLIIVVAIVYCWLIPFLAIRLANAVPPSYEEQIGQQSYDALIKSYTIDTTATRYANEFFRRMKVTTQYPVQITVVEEKQANAFALPGGHIIVYNGLLQQMQHYEELAALLGHEYAHITLKHTTRTIFSSMGAYAFASLLFGDLTGVGAVVVQNANSLKGLEYSRKLEKEADLYGLQLLEQRHISAEGYTWLFNTLKQQPGRQQAEWLSSHPDLAGRSRYIQAQAQPATTAVTDPALLQVWKEMKD